MTGAMKWKDLPEIAWAHKELALWIACIFLMAWAIMTIGFRASDRTDTLGQDLSVSSQTFGSAPPRYYPAPRPTTQDQDYPDCSAKALGPDTLLLNCTQSGQHVVTLNDIFTLPPSHELGKQASQVLNSVVGEKNGSLAAVKVACKPEESAWACYAKSTCGDTKGMPGTCMLDLRLPLLASGLAVTTDRFCAKPDLNRELCQAQSRAQRARLGIWVDLTTNTAGSAQSKSCDTHYDPLLWRIGRDATISFAESTEAQRGQAKSNFNSSVLIGFLGFLVGFVGTRFSQLRAEYTYSGLFQEDVANLRNHCRSAIAHLRKTCDDEETKWEHATSAFATLQADYKKVTDGIEVFNKKLQETETAYPKVLTKSRSAYSKLRDQLQRLVDDLEPEISQDQQGSTKTRRRVVASIDASGLIEQLLR